MAFAYKLYNKKISSQVKLGVLPIMENAKSPDILIKITKIVTPPSDLENTIYKPFSIYNANFYYLNIEGIAKFLVKKDVIHIEKSKESSYKDVLAFLLDTVLPVCLIFNDVFLLHAAAIRSSSKAYVFCSNAGNGKTMLSLFFAKMKKAIIEDDKVFLEFNDKKKRFEVNNQIPFVEIWKDGKSTIDKISNITFINKVRGNIQKLRYSIENTIPKVRTPVTKIFLIAVDNGEAEPNLKPTRGIAKINSLKTFTICEHLISDLGKSAEHFKFISKICSHAEVIAMRRSRLTKLKVIGNYLFDEITA